VPWSSSAWPLVGSGKAVTLVSDDPSGCKGCEEVSVMASGVSRTVPGATGIRRAFMRKTTFLRMLMSKSRKKNELWDSHIYLGK